MDADVGFDPLSLLDAYLARDGVCKTLGISVSHLALGEATTQIAVSEAMLNGHGSGHGAVIFALADVAFSLACNSRGRPAVGRSCSVEFLAPAMPGDVLIATARERSRAGRGAIYDVAVTRASDGRLLAEMRGHSRELTLSPAVPPVADG